jgi:hypothetical protein
MTGVSQTIITPKIGMEKSFPKLVYENDPVIDCPSTTSKVNLIAGLEATQYFTDDWMLAVQVLWTRYSFKTDFTCGWGSYYFKHKYNKLRTGIGAKYKATSDFQLQSIYY